MTDAANSRTGLRADSPDRYDRILHAIGSTLDRLDAWPDHPRALEALADAVESLIDKETETGQRRAVRIQTLLDEERDRARRDAIAGRESERQLQQQIAAQAKEIDRLREERRFERDLSDNLRNRLKATSDAYSDADTALHELRKGPPYPDAASKTRERKETL